MKITVVLLGLVIWNLLLTGVLYVGYEIAVGQAFEVASLRQDLSKARVRISRDETVLVQLNKQLGKTGTREHELELIVAKLISILTEPDSQNEKPSSDQTKSWCGSAFCAGTPPGWIVSSPSR